MSALRVILIVFGALLLAGIYWWGRRADVKRRAEAVRHPPAADADVALLSPQTNPRQELPAPTVVRAEPTLSETEPSVADAELAPVEDEIPIAPSAPATKILALRLVATTPRFSGAHLRTALEAESLVFGRYQIFHRTTPAGDILFSVASMLEPGSFDLEQMFHEQYPGIALFAQLPAAQDGMTVLNDLIACARKLQQSLGGVLQDEQGTPLIAFRIEQLRREVREFEQAARPLQPRNGFNRAAHDPEV